MSRFVSGNQIVLLRNGTEYFPALLQALDAARSEIHLQTYIYEDDAIGRSVADALKRAAARGVAVCVLLDGFGSKEIPPKFVEALEQAGVDVLFYHPLGSPWTLRRRRLRRLHGKVVVVDGVVALVGGINIIDDMHTPGHTPPRVDYAVSVRGPLLKAIWVSTRRLWRRTAWSHLQHAAVFPGVWQREIPDAGRMRAAYVVRDNLWHRRDIEEAYLAAIERAESEIIIANSYFLPGIRFRRALVAAVRRGVHVRLLLQARVEYVLLDYASRALYGQLLAGGVEIYEYHKSFMHSKVAVMDGVWATVGSSNIDPFSLLLAREANVVVADAAFAEALRQDVMHAIDTGARRVRAEDWAHASWARRFLAQAGYAAIRLAMAVAGLPEHR